jgi:DNA primase
LRARTPLAALIGRRVKLARSGRQMKGCCPFHGEKTPSFYVYEDGYHCFGCGAHGDAISFVMQTQGASFPEAVQSLASEAGLDLPKSTPSAQAAERARLDLHAVLDAAATYYQRRLLGAEGTLARTYLQERGLTPETIARFGLGWSGEGRGALAAELGKSGISPAQILQAGLLRQGDSGDIRGELFFNRVMFPIRDRTGRVISFGGRIMGAGQPKYVNGPETPLFSKRRTLYALDFARAATRTGATLVAVEGYMDVIALHQAGFGGAVAPLGTALTTEQLEELWRLSPAPILCFDGDAAGGRAAARAAQTALPALAPDRTIRIATLPAGEDPDTLVRRQGPAAFESVLAGARPLDEALFDLLRSAGGDTTPEQRSQFRRRLESAAAAINDRSLASEYRRALLDRYFTANRRNSGPKPVRTPPRPIPGADAATISRARKLTAILLHHPDLSRDLEEAYGALPLPEPLHPLRAAILAYFSHIQPEDSAPLDSAHLINHLHALGLSMELQLTLDETPSCGRPGVQPAVAEAGWWHFYGLMHREGLETAVEAARHHFVENPSDAPTLARFNALCLALFRLRRGEQSDIGQDEDGEIFED